MISQSHSIAFWQFRLLQEERLWRILNDLNILRQTGKEQELPLSTTAKTNELQ